MTDKRPVTVFVKELFLVSCEKVGGGGGGGGGVRGGVRGGDNMISSLFFHVFIFLSIFFFFFLSRISHFFKNGWKHKLFQIIWK